jgi:hypothetical protein
MWRKEQHEMRDVRTKGGGNQLNSTVLLEDAKKKRCMNCGKKLTLFNEFYHPTLGTDALLCGECFESVWDSEVRWGRFVIWNSFNPDAPDPTYLDTYPFPTSHKKIRHKKIF